jgi:hypothetical protein
MVLLLYNNMKNAVRYQYLNSMFSSMKGDNIYLQTTKGQNEMNEWIALRLQRSANVTLKVYPTKVNGVVVCPCGGKYQKHGRKRHEQTSKHSKWITERTLLRYNNPTT